jgi:leader peptidase (prepilin peptidase) / N-methyltransferase
MNMGDLPGIFLAAFGGLFGGYLVNYFSDLLPAQRKLSSPVCSVCRETQPWKDFFFCLLKYPRCGDRRSSRTWLVLLLGIALSLWYSFSPPGRIGYLSSYLLFVYFGVVVVIDVEHKLILHPVSLVGYGLGIVLGTLRHGLVDTLIGGLVGFGLMLGFYLLGELFARWLRARRGLPEDEVALGFGDVNLAAVVGLLLGWPGVVPGILLAILLGGAGSLLYIIWMWASRRLSPNSAIPYGPFLVLAAIILLFR